MPLAEVKRRGCMQGKSSDILCLGVVYMCTGAPPKSGYNSNVVLSDREMRNHKTIRRRSTPCITDGQEWEEA